MNMLALVANWIEIDHAMVKKKDVDLFMTLTFDPIDPKI